MRVSKSYRETLNSRIKIRVSTIDGDKITGKHEVSNYPITAICTRSDIEIHVGQVIEVEYINNQHIQGYTVRSSLMERTSATVLYVQHIIADSMIYVSLILQTKDGKRMHSLIPNTMKAFKQASLLIPNDNILVKTNNGNLFEIIL